MIELLRLGKEYDAEHGEPDCELDEKMAFLRKVAARVGVDLDEEMAKKPKTPKRKRKAKIAPYVKAYEAQK